MNHIRSSRKMMFNYAPPDYSPIFWPDEKPVNVGMYPSEIDAHFASLSRTGACNPILAHWDGAFWTIGGSRCLHQNRYWFGLNKRP